MEKNIIIFDLETRNTFDDVGGHQNSAKLDISVLGAYDYLTKKFSTYEADELPRFFERLQTKPLIVGFNSRKFDTPILQRYCKFDLKKLPQLDIMEEMVKALGHRVSLESVAQATLNLGKSGSGLDAIKYWREGKLEELKKYCLDDVKITRDIFEYGAAHGELFYTSKYGPAKAKAPVSWKLAHPDESEKPDTQQSLF